MSSDGGSEPEHRGGIKRVRQACVNCRRKKAKCSGERPICGHCKRLGQDCQYWGRSQGMENEVQPRPTYMNGISEYPSVVDAQETLSSKVAAIETNLNQLINNLNVLLPGMAKQQSEERMISTLSNSAAYPHSQNDTNFSAGDHQTDSGGTQEPFSTLPPPVVVDSLVETYFSRCHNQPYSFFHERNFKAKLAQNAMPDYLIFAVLASALRFSQDAYFIGAWREASRGYARASWQRIVSTWFAAESDPTVPICQTMTLLSIFDYTEGRRHPAWLKIGLSIRVAQDLRLMMEPDPGLSFAEQEEQRRVFWSIYVLDKLCSCGRARPSAINDTQCRVQLPCDEQNFRDGRWEETQTLKQAFAENEGDKKLGPFALAVLTASILGKCAQHSIHEHHEGSRLPPWDSKSDFATIYSCLLRLETQLDIGSRINDILMANYLQDGAIDMQIAGSFVFSHALFYASQCLLHHPFLLCNQSQAWGMKIPASFLSRALQTCRESADSMSALLQDMDSAGCPTYYSFVGYCTTVTASIHISYLQDKNQEVCQKAARCLRVEVAFLEEFSKYWKNGKSMLALLHKVATGNTSSKAHINASPCSPCMKNIDPSELETLWATVDYSVMSEEISPDAPLLSVSAISGEWDYVPPPQSTMPYEHHLNGIHATDLMVGDPSGFNPMLYGNMSTLSSFFGNSPPNFGG